MNKLFNDPSIFEDEVVIYRDVDAPDKIGIVLTVGVGYSCVEVLLTKSELVKALSAITDKEEDYE